MCPAPGGTADGRSSASSLSTVGLDVADWYEDHVIDPVASAPLGLDGNQGHHDVLPLKAPLVLSSAAEADASGGLVVAELAVVKCSELEQELRQKAERICESDELEGLAGLPGVEPAGWCVAVPAEGPVRPPGGPAKKRKKKGVKVNQHAKYEAEEHAAELAASCAATSRVCESAPQKQQTAKRAVTVDQEAAPAEPSTEAENAQNT